MSVGGKLVAPDMEHPFIKRTVVLETGQVRNPGTAFHALGPVVCRDLETDPWVNVEWESIILKRKGTKISGSSDFNR